MPVYIGDQGDLIEKVTVSEDQKEVRMSCGV
jgi:hypothetical protein